MTKTRGTLYEDQYTFMIVFPLVFLRVENFQIKFVEEIKHAFYVG